MLVCTWRVALNTTSNKDTVNNVHDMSCFPLQVLFGDLTFLILGAAWLIRACRRSVIKEITSVFYLVSLDSDDVLAIKSLFLKIMLFLRPIIKWVRKRACQRKERSWRLQSVTGTLCKVEFVVPQLLNAWSFCGTLIDVAALLEVFKVTLAYWQLQPYAVNLHVSVK